jgi:hypothetical protein
LTLPDTPKGDAVKYVLDGQQRLTSLFVTLKGLSINREDRTDDFSRVWVDLAADEEQEIILIDIEGRDSKEIIQLKDLLLGDFAYLASFQPEFQQKIRTYKNRVESYQFSTILMKDSTIDVATEVFERLNVGGKRLSVFEIMVAKTYDPETNFDLAEKYKALISNLQAVDYGTLSSTTILQAVSVLLRKDCRKKEILNLTKQDVIKVWPKAVEAIKNTVDYFRNYYRIPVSRLLPYPALIIPFAYFFYRHPDKPTGDRQKFLHDFFWRVSLGGRYSQSVENRVAQDIDKEPKSFVDNSIVRLDNAYLKQANSKNYHHFFPKAWLEKEGEDWRRINHVANITLVDDFLNKRVIRAQSPKAYMKDFIKDNPDIDKCLATHLIRLNDAYGVMTNEYVKFFDARCRAISRELNKQVIPQAIDQLEVAKPAEETVQEEEEQAE